MHKKYDLVVIGAGSGGIAAANRAAEHGASVAIIESGDLGGTCVNVGCVPKKIMWMASQRQVQIEQATGFGFPKQKADLNWDSLVQKRQNYITRLHGLYQKKLFSNKITLISGTAKFVASNIVAIGQKQIQAKHILIATGSTPRWPDIPGKDLGIDSDGFFALKALPKRVAIVGGGYIAVELAGMLQGFGSDVSLIFRGKNILRGFDETMTQTLYDIYQNDGMHIYAEHTLEELRQTPNGLVLQCLNKKTIPPVDTVIWAIGRTPNIQHLNLPAIDIKQNADNSLWVDDYQNTSQKNIYAVGDVTGKAPLTPVAIKAGRKLSERLFNNRKNFKVDYQNIPTVIYSHPPIGSVGLSETQAIAEHGQDNIKIFNANFTPMLSSFSEDKIPCVIKLIIQKSNDKVIGCHLIGDFADEILQGFAVAIRMGATKADFDETMAIHPTVSEELVTLR
tara:strand:- start:37781 stop:39130 length:1350 start_codon:yes stop_codon:yes gene_type:complete